MRGTVCRKIGLIGLTLALFLLSGCGGSELSRIYVKAVGFDYNDGKYIVYLQILNFANEAKSESPPQAGGMIPIWTGKSSSNSLGEAMDQMMNSSQRAINVSHVTAFVLSGRLLKHMSRNDLSELLARYPDIRFNIWMFSTDLPIDRIFTTKAFFNISETNTVLHSPEVSYAERSAIEPVYFFKLLRERFHMAMSDYIPELGIDERTWKSNMKKYPKLEITGAHFSQNGVYKGLLNRRQLDGWHWMNPRMKRWDMTIYGDNKEYGTAKFTRTKPKIIVRRDGSGRPVFDVRVSVKGVMSIRKDKSPLSEVGRAAGSMIESQIRSTYMNALTKEIDIYQFMERYYRLNYKEWKQQTSEGKEFMIDKQSLGDIKVDVHLEIPGRYKP